MKSKRYSALLWMPVAVAIQLVASNAPAQTPVLINAFDNADEVGVNNGNPWGNWFGTAYYQVVWDSSDASNNVNSGSMKIETFYPDSGIGGCCGPQFVVYNGNDGINPPLDGNGGNPAAALATNVEFDVRFEPTSFYDTNNNNWPTIEVGTRGVDFGQHDFGTFTVSHDVTGWTHVVMPIAASANWTTIPNIFFKYYSTAYDSSPTPQYLSLYVDNITFVTASVPTIPPTMAIQKATPGLRMFAGPDQYARTQLVAVDTNQSWVGGSYPVSYSFTVSGYDLNPPLNQMHMFLIPFNYIQGGTVDQYTDYSTALNSVRLQIVAGNAGDPTVVANLGWKTNIVNSDPNNLALSITNSTAIGTWTLTFTSATDGTLTAPGASPAPFSIPANVAAQFANPLLVFFGLLPNTTTSLGQHVDFTKFQTTGVASPGVPINSDFTTMTGITNSGIWSLRATAATTTMSLVSATTPWWVSWSYPDYGSVLATKPDLTSAVPWKSVFYYTGYDTNSVFVQKEGNKVWSLVPSSGLPTVDGSSNGVKSATAFFQTISPGPAE